MDRGAWDFMLDGETYELLEEYYGDRVGLSTVVSNSDRAFILRLLDDIVEDLEDFPDPDLERKVKAAKRRVQSA